MLTPHTNDPNEIFEDEEEHPDYCDGCDGRPCVCADLAPPAPPASHVFRIQARQLPSGLATVHVTAGVPPLYLPQTVRLDAHMARELLDLWHRSGIDPKLREQLRAEIAELDHLARLDAAITKTLSTEN